MARYIYQTQTRDGFGRVIQGATATVYLATTTTLATIYSQSSGGSAISGSSVVCDSRGYFSFWVDDSDYALSQAFKVVTSMQGYQSITFDNLQIMQFHIRPIFIIAHSSRTKNFS